jgi:EAL domain-containing protein (putative c-di-GMP-specific phosphodiesterase class I)
MQQYGINQLQGYYVGMPVPAAQLEVDNVLQFNMINNGDYKRVSRNGQ